MTLNFVVRVIALDRPVQQFDRRQGNNSHRKGMRTSITLTRTTQLFCLFSKNVDISRNQSS